MILLHQRQILTQNSTIGTLILGDFNCFTLEPTLRQGPKVWGKTAIPAGQYAIKLRTDPSRMNDDYTARFGSWHKGMLWLQDIPDFQDVYIHIGNFPHDTEGCILVGVTKDVDVVYESEVAYRQLYPQVSGAILQGDDVVIQIEDPS